MDYNFLFLYAQQLKLSICFSVGLQSVQVITQCSKGILQVRAGWRIEGSVPLIKSCLTRQTNFRRLLSHRQSFTRLIVAVSKLWCCCDNLGPGDIGGELAWCGSWLRMLVE